MCLIKMKAPANSLTVQDKSQLFPNLVNLMRICFPGGKGWGSGDVAFLPDKRRLRESWLGEVDEGEDAECVSPNPLKAFCLLGWVNSLCARGIMHSFLAYKHFT